ncbi:guided entry of tail-anchored proteins factor 1-like [Phoenix dactylifera]|uniref:Guided entry of tail-anchored proteins factor 1-like n=1 Tax=Phoenix dactylifera TaxID=42345 RepID=A0A8B7D3D8_PHODC|nr:guided entry of tail-anchored proteins factor 1-like [Phoenix dactylifera]
MGGGTPGDGDPLSPLSILLLVVLLQLLDGFVEFLRKRGLRSNEEFQLRQEIEQLLKEAGKLSMPSTFAQVVKLKRAAAAKEKELSKRHEEYSKEKKWSYDMFARALLVLKVILYAGLIWHFWGVPVAAVPQHLLQPFGRFLSCRSGDAVTGQIMVGIIPWLLLATQVSKFLCQKLSIFFFMIKS